MYCMLMYCLKPQYLTLQTIKDAESLLNHHWNHENTPENTITTGSIGGWPRKSISNTQRSSMPLTPSSSPSSLWVLVALSWMEQFSWIYLPKNNLSTIPVDVVISEVSVRYQLAAQVSVVPAGWHLHFVSPGADRLAAGVGTAVAVTHMTSLVPIQTTWLPQGQACVTLTLPLPIHLPLHYIWNLVEYMYSDPSLMCLVVYPENLEIQENSVTKNMQMNVIGWLMAAPQVNPEITGLKYSKMSALEKLCLELKACSHHQKRAKLQQVIQVLCQEGLC
ncbi:uncharacterized protein LOC135098513 isoform X5 [Scylla paramamosain]|uniref:uncharacterized protein LOC135098513 isoform X5 n=1 Tax=Scylla paramamosain TaxID=85552 RepID=UPI003083D482